jgi:iron complex outermembrane receptor protein
MKKRTKNSGMSFPLFKIDLKLKITTILLFVTLFNVQANTYAQRTKVSLELNNSTIEKVIETIQQSTDFRFIYDTNDIDLDRIISISVKEQTIDVVLAKLFKGTATSFKISDTQIILKKQASNTVGTTNFRQTVKGKVVDEKGMPLPGATVTEENTKNAVLTDDGGNFEINVENNAVLVISYIGYTDKKIGAGTDLSRISLTPESTQLAELVVIGYGSAKRKDVTGAISSVAEKDMNKGAFVNPLQLIAGKMAGVNVTQTGSEPGSAPSVRIRGITSLNGGSDPLVVVDGIQGNLEILSQIPPTEIATVDVLKDASATAIYGSRGAPGVIIVTTKRNKAGKTNVEFNSTVSVDAIPKELDMLNAGQWWKEAQLIGVPASSNHGANTDWYNILTQRGFTQNYSLSFGGGADKFSYRASINAILQDGVVINSNNKKYIGTIQATQSALDDKLKLTFNLNSGITNNTQMVQSIGNAAFTSNLISIAYLMRPTDPVYNTNGTYFTDPTVFQYQNPYAVAQTVRSGGQQDNLFGSLKADLTVLDGLTATWFGSWRKTNLTNGFFIPVESTNANAINQNGFANIDNKRQNERLMNMGLNYVKTFGKHAINVIGLYEWQNQTYTGSYAQVRGFLNDIASYNALQLGDISAALPGDEQSYKNDRTLVSFLGRASYSFLDRYLLTASIRRDGSTVFGANYKWGNFPSASVAWQIHKEPFMANQKIFNELKIRAGYGVTGNQQGLLPHNSINLVRSDGNVAFGGTIMPYYAPSQNANPDLRWETKRQTDIGLEFTMLNNRLRGTFDIYKSVTDDLLFTYTVPLPPYPFDQLQANVGSLQNTGMELGLGYDIIKTEHTTLTFAGNVSLLRNKVLTLSGYIDGRYQDTNNVAWGPNAYLIEGQPIGTFNILHHTGINEQGAETVRDVNGDGLYDQGITSADRIKKGSVLPKYTYALNPTFQYKNLFVSMLWRGSGGNKIYNQIKSQLSMEENIGKANILESATDLGIHSSEYQSDVWLEDGSFLRLENATIAYDLNFKSVKYIDGLRLSVTGNNLWLITKYSGIDPELNFSGANGGGGDMGIYPRTRSIALGLNVRFK